MKRMLFLGALVLSATVCSQSYGFELLDRMLGHHGCTDSCCEPACDAGAACCEPACDAGAACCEPACDAGASSCCEPRCRKKHELFGGLKGLFAKSRSVTLAVRTAAASRRATPVRPAASPAATLVTAAASPPAMPARPAASLLATLAAAAASPARSTAARSWASSRRSTPPRSVTTAVPTAAVSPAATPATAAASPAATPMAAASRLAVPRSTTVSSLRWLPLRSWTLRLRR